MLKEDYKKKIKELQKGEYIPLSGDLQFKYIFGTNENIKYTTDLLELMLKKEKDSLKGLRIESEVKLDKETVRSKSFELDIIVRLSNGNVINLEMQRMLGRDAEIKNTLYVTKLFGSMVKRGEKYRNINKIIQIEIIEKNKRHKTKDKINYYHISNDKEPKDKILEDIFEIMTIDIEKEKEVSYNEDINERLERYLELIKAKELEEAIEIAYRDGVLMEVLEKLVRFNNNEYVQDYRREQALIESEKETEVEEALKEGKNLGRIEGEKSKAIEIAKLMINNNEELSKIIAYTNLMKEEIEKLKDEINF